jgi:serine/threonine protein kinase
MASRALQLANFKKIKVLGSTSLGKSYLTQERTTQELFVVKTFKDVTNESDERLDWVDFLVHIEHPALLSIYGYSLPNTARKKPLAFCTRYCPDGSLAGLLESKKTITNGSRLKILFGIAEALRHLHTVGITHQLLIPTNILVDVNFEPKLCDFGFAGYKSVDMPPFAAPYNENATEFALDIFCYAAVVYTVLTENPFPETGLPEIGDEIPTPFKELMLDCWNSPPDDRPQPGSIVMKFLKGTCTLPMASDERFDYEEYRARVVAPVVTNRRLIGAINKLHGLNTRTKQLTEAVQKLEQSLAALSGARRSANEGAT